jgi:hypothetical protein
MISKLLYSKSRIRNHELKNRGLSLLLQVAAPLTLIIAPRSTLSNDQSPQVTQFPLETAVSPPTPILNPKGIYITTLITIYIDNNTIQGEGPAAYNTILLWRFLKMQNKK